MKSLGIEYLIGKTVTSAEDISRDTWDDSYKLTLSTGEVVYLKSYGHAYCSSSLDLVDENDY